jgi:hypothetical protein
MSLRIISVVFVLAALDSWSQGHTGTFKVSDTKTTYHFTLKDGNVTDAVYTIDEGMKHIHTMYLPDSAFLSGIDSLTVVHKKDSLLKHFLLHFSGTYAEYTKSGRKLVVMRLSEAPDSTQSFYTSTETQRMNFYPNGNPYAQFNVENGIPARSVIYFTRDGETDFISDLSQYAKGEEVLIQNPWDFRMRKKMLKIVIQ